MFMIGVILVFFIFMFGCLCIVVFLSDVYMYV